MNPNTSTALNCRHSSKKYLCFLLAVLAGSLAGGCSKAPPQSPEAVLLQVDAKYRDATGFGLAMLNEGDPKFLAVGVIKWRGPERDKTMRIWDYVQSLSKSRYPNVLPKDPAQLVPGRWPIFRLTAEGDVVMGLE